MSGQKTREAEDRFPALELLDRDNYESWKLRMKFALDARGLGAAIEPTSGDSKIDVDMDRRARGFIGMYVKEHLLNVVNEHKSAYTVWAALENVFKAQTKARKLELRRQMTALDQRGEKVGAYIARAKALYNDMQAAGLDVKESDMIYAVLAGLSSMFRVQVEIMINTLKEEELTFSNLQSRLITAEAEYDRKHKRELTEVAAMYASTSRKSHSSVSKHDSKPNNGECFHCGKPGHRKHECVDWLTEQLERVQTKSGKAKCDYCNKTGHSETECRNKKRDQNNGSALFATSNSKTNVSPVTLLAL
jgi:molybdopterin-biosynthesis enzyme MoeA-like protein